MTFAAEPSDLQFVQSLMVPRQVVEAYLMHDINAHSCTHKKHKLGSNFFWRQIFNHVTRWGSKCDTSNREHGRIGKTLNLIPGLKPELDDTFLHWLVTCCDVKPRSSWRNGGWGKTKWLWWTSCTDGIKMTVVLQSSSSSICTQRMMDLADCLPWENDLIQQITNLFLKELSVSFVRGRLFQKCMICSQERSHLKCNVVRLHSKAYTFAKQNCPLPEQVHLAWSLHIGRANRP